VQVAAQAVIGVTPRQPHLHERRRCTVQRSEGTISPQDNRGQIASDAMKLRNLLAGAALLAVGGCAVYPSGSVAYGTGYYPYPAYDGIYGPVGIGVGWNSYPLYHEGGYGHWHDHRFGFAHHDFDHPHFAGGFHGGFHGGGFHDHGAFHGHPGGMGRVGMVGHHDGPHG
jgi:hypothetical protein